MRKDAREAAYRYIYSFLMTNEADEELKKEVYKEHKLNDKDVEFADALIRTVIEHLPEFTGVLSELSVGFTEERVNPLDKDAIFVAMAEIDYFDDIDNPVSINEAVGLCKKYSGDTSVNFVNGVLASYLRRNKNVG